MEMLNFQVKKVKTIVIHINLNMTPNNSIGEQPDQENIVMQQWADKINEVVKKFRELKNVPHNYIMVYLKDPIFNTLPQIPFELAVVESEKIRMYKDYVEYCEELNTSKNK